MEKITFQTGWVATCNLQAQEEHQVFVVTRGVLTSGNFLPACPREVYYKSAKRVALRDINMSKNFTLKTFSTPGALITDSKYNMKIKAQNGLQTFDVLVVVLLRAH